MFVRYVRYGTLHHTLLSLRPFLVCGLRKERKIVEILLLFIHFPHHIQYCIVLNST
jgi:hypothetical protein